jgi:metal-sulfur cluster biosynthetic enzyme
VSGEDDPEGPNVIGSSGETLPERAIAKAWDALRTVYDPELYIDIVSLGLVYDVREEDGVIVVEMTLTTPGCPASESLPEMARAAIAESLGTVSAVEAHVVWDPPWNPEMIDADEPGARGFRVR